MQNYLSSLKYPRNGMAIVPIGLGVLCLFITYILTRFSLFIFNSSHVFRRKDFPAYGILYIGLILLFFLLAYLSNMVLNTAEGNDTICDSPQFLDRFEDVVWEPGYRSLTAILTYTLPAIISMYFGAFALGGILLAIGCFFLPMVFMRTAVLESLEGINHKTCLHFLNREPVAYLKLLTFSLIWFLLLALPVVTFFHLGENVVLHTLLILVYSVYTFYFLAVYMNILGRFYREYVDSIEEE